MSAAGFDNLIFFSIGRVLTKSGKLEKDFQFQAAGQDLVERVLLNFIQGVWRWGEFKNLDNSSFSILWWIVK